MGKRIDNVKAALGDGSTRIRVIGTAVVLVVGAVIGLLSFKGRSDSGVAAATTPAAPVAGTVATAPAAQSHPVYDGLVAKQNSNAVAEAQRSGASAVPVIRAQPVESMDPPVDVPPPPAPEVNASSTPPQPGPNPEEEKARLAKQEARKQAMMKQASLMMNSWDPSAHNAITVLASAKAEQSTADVGSATASGMTTSSRPTPASIQPSAPKVLAVAGVDIYYALSRTAINSDLPGPVVVDVVTGPLKGAVLIGAYTLPKNASATVLSFKTASNVPGASASIAIDAIAVDVATTSYGIASDVDHHSLERWGSLLGASFLKGAGKAVTAMGQNSNVISTPTQTVIQTDKLNTKQIVTAGLGEFGDQLSEEVKGGFNRPPTVTVKARQEMGILFLADVVTK